MAGFIQVPADAGGKRVDTVTLTDATVEVHRQKIVMTGGSGTAEVCVVTDAAPASGDMGLVVRQAGTVNVAVTTGTFNLSGTAIVAGSIDISSMPAVVLAAGASNIGSINNISRTVQVAVGTPFTVNNISATVVVSGLIGLTAGTSVIGDLNAISRTVQVAIGTPFTLQGISTTVNVAIATPFVIQGISTTVTTGLSYVIEKTSNSQVQVGDSANAAIRVNVVAGAAGGVSQVDGTTFTSQAANFIPIGGIFDDASPDTLSENDAGVVRLTTNRAFHVNIRDAAGAELGAASATGIFVRTATIALAADQILGSISRTVQVAVGTPFTVNNISATVVVSGLVGLTAGSSVIGDINAISRTVQVAIGTPFTLQGISTTVNVAIATPFTVNNISAAVVLAAGANNIGSLNHISRTVEVTVSTPFTVNNISAAVVLAAGAANIGSINHISRTVVCGLSYVLETGGSQVTVGDSANSAIRVNIVAGGGSGGTAQTDGTTFTSQAALFTPIGGIFDDAASDALSENDAGIVRMTTNRAFHINLRDTTGAELGAASATGLFIRTATVTLAAGAANVGTINNISAAVTTTGLVGLTAGTSVIGDLNAISRTVQVAIGTPFILQGISTTVNVAIATPFILQGISTTVQVAIATPYILQGISTTVSVITSAQMAHDSSVTAGVVPVQTGFRANLSAPIAVANGDATYAWADQKGRLIVGLNHPALLSSASHGPKCVTCSTSAGVALIAAPGAGLAVYITKIACTNGSGTLTRADVFQVSATASCICQMYMAASGGGFTMDYNPPIQVQSNSGVTCRVKPSVSQAIFNVHFYVGNK